MKKVFFVLIFSILTLNVIKAEIRHPYEAMFTLINYGTAWNVKFSFEAVSTRWDENFNFTNGYVYGDQTVVQPQTQTGFGLIISNDGDQPIMALGLYKITAYENNVETAWFYLDLRTSDFSQSPDMYFKYDVANNRFMNQENTVNINESTQTVWDLVAGIDQVTSEFETSIPQNNTVTNYNGIPLISWERLLTDDYVTGYDIYRSFTSPNVGFTKIGSSSELYYIDNEVSVGSGAFVYYKVKAVNGSRISNYSNVSSINYNGINKNIINPDIVENVVYNFDLAQNYPNPFNPSTSIKYSLSSTGKVTLKVYDITGNEVKTLIDRTQNPGVYEINFDADKLPSGVYIYQLTQNNLRISKKLTLIK